MRRKITVFLIIAVCIWFYERKKRRTVDWLFHRTSFRYFYRKYFGILCTALYVCGIFQRIFPENVLPGRYQTADASDRSQRFFMQSDHLFPVIFIPWKV